MVDSNSSCQISSLGSSMSNSQSSSQSRFISKIVHVRRHRPVRSSARCQAVRQLALRPCAPPSGFASVLGAPQPKRRAKAAGLTEDEDVSERVRRVLTQQTIARGASSNWDAAEEGLAQVGTGADDTSGVDRQQQQLLRKLARLDECVGENDSLRSLCSACDGVPSACVRGVT